MFDSHLRPLIDPPLNQIGKALAGVGLGANAVTLIGLGFGLMAAIMISVGLSHLALIPLLIGRLADGLDGAVARHRGKTDFGGYLDLFCDFILYGAVPLAFAVLDPGKNALAAAFLLMSFYVNAASFLGFAIMAEKQGLTTTAQGQKSLYYASGLLEGFETIVFFVILCLWPAIFAPAAWVFGALCGVTAGARLLWARSVLR